MRLTQHLKLTREERMDHIDLSSPCDLSMSRSSRRRKGRQVLLTLLGIEDDIENWVESKIQLCHHCNHGSTNGWCLNPLHYSIGTVSENHSDKSKEAKMKGPLASVQFRRLNKVKRKQNPNFDRNWSVKAGKTTGSQKWMSLHDGYISVPGGVASHNKALGVDPNHKIKLTSEEAAFIFLWEAV